MLEMFYAGALRVSEIVAVKLEDLKLDLGYVLVRGKGDKERIVPLGKSAQEILATYMKHARPLLAGERTSPLLFLGRGSAQAYPPARVADGSNCVSKSGTQRQPAHVAPQLRNSHGREWRGPAHGSDDSRPFRYFDYAGVHASGA